MADVYFDPDGAYDPGSQTGVSGNPYGGPAGAQHCLDLVGTTETAFGSAGTCQVDKFITFDYNTLAGGVFAQGDTVTGTAWSAMVYADNGVDEMTVEMITGAVPADNNAFNNGGGVSATTDNPANVVYPGLQLKASGASTTGGYCGLIGTDATWNPYAGQVILDCNDVVPIALTMAGYDYWNIGGITAKDTTGDGIYGTGNNYMRFYKIHCDNCGTGGTGMGMNLTALHALINCCVFEDCEQDGLYLANTDYSQIMNSVFNHNGRYGIHSVSGSNGCFFNNITVHGNTSTGIEMNGNYGFMQNLVVDGNGNHGIRASTVAGSTSVVYSRFSNNAVNAFSADNTAPCATLYNNWNVLYNNGGDYETDRWDAGPDSVSAANTTELGYRDIANHDFRLTPAAILRRFDSGVGWLGNDNNEVSASAGLIPADLRARVSGIRTGGRM